MHPLSRQPRNCSRLLSQPAGGVADIVYIYVNHTDIEPIPGAVYSLGGPLGAEHIDISVVRCDAGWQNRPYKYTDSDHKESYILIGAPASDSAPDAVAAEPAGETRWATDSFIG